MKLNEFVSAYYRCSFPTRLYRAAIEYYRDNSQSTRCNFFLEEMVRKNDYTLCRDDIHYMSEIANEVFPELFEAFLVLLAIANSMGTVASAGVGVAEKLCAFVMLVPSAYMQAMSAFVAQNIGAGREDRARRALWCGVASSVAAGLVMAWAGFFHGDLLSAIFAEDARVVSAGWEYLKAYSIDCLLTSFLFCFMGYFNGRGETMFVMVQGFAGAFGVRLPVALVMSRLLPESLFALGLSTPSSTAVQIVLCVIWYLRRQRKPSALCE